MRRYMVLLWALSFMTSSTLISMFNELSKNACKNKPNSRYVMVNDLEHSDSSKKQESLESIEKKIGVEGKKPEYFIAEHTQKLIDQARGKFQSESKYLKEVPDDWLTLKDGNLVNLKDSFRTDYCEELARIVLNAGASMSNQAKLEHLIGDEWYEVRKYIVVSMITVEKIDPNDITVNGLDPLSEALFFKDVNFARFLLESGCSKDRVLKRFKKEIENNKELQALFFFSQPHIEDVD